MFGEPSFEFNRKRRCQCTCIIQPLSFSSSIHVREWKHKRREQYRNYPESQKSWHRGIYGREAIVPASIVVPRYDIFFHSEPSGGFSLIQRGWDLCQRLQRAYSKRRDFSRAKKKGAITRRQPSKAGDTLKITRDRQCLQPLSSSDSAHSICSAVSCRLQTGDRVGRNGKTPSEFNVRRVTELYELSPCKTYQALD